MDIKLISAEEFDRRFDDGEDMGDYVDWAGRSAEARESVVVALPNTVIVRLDAAAEEAGVTRQALIEGWIANELDKASQAA